MSRSKQLLLVVAFTVITLVCWTYVRRTSPFHDSVQFNAFILSKEDLQWQARAKATADNPIQARQVILDGIYADEALPVTLGYQEAMNEEPASQIRAANFGHAAVIANEFYDIYKHHQNMRAFIDLIDQGQVALQPLIKRRQDVGSKEEFQEYQNFKPTKIADAWLAWANYTDDKQAEAAYHHALQLDPTLGEAYYQEAHRATMPFSQRYFEAHRVRAMQQLDKAAQIEPKLRPLVALDRGSIAQCSGNYPLAITYYRKFLLLWPNAPQADMLRQNIIQLEAEKKPNAK